MKQRIALFESQYGISAYEEKQEPYLEGYVRVTEYVTIDFPKLPLETIVVNHVSVIDREIDEIKSKAMEEVAKLQTRKAELLALTHEVAA